MVYAVSTGAHRWDNHLHKFHRGVTRGLNDNQPKRRVLEKLGKSRVTCLLPGCFKEVIHLSRHLRNVHSISVSEYCLMLGIKEIEKEVAKEREKKAAKGIEKEATNSKEREKKATKGIEKEAAKEREKKGGNCIHSIDKTGDIDEHVEQHILFLEKNEEYNYVSEEVLAA